MKAQELQTAIDELMGLFNGSFINAQNELILIPKTNLYFRLADVETIDDLYVKIIAFCSRDACKSMPYYASKRNEKYQNEVRYALNEYLGVDFSKDEWETIYAKLGGGCNHELCKKFVKSTFDLSLLKE